MNIIDTILEAHRRDGSSIDVTVNEAKELVEKKYKYEFEKFMNTMVISPNAWVTETIMTQCLGLFKAINRMQFLLAQLPSEPKRRVGRPTNAEIEARKKEHLPVATIRLPQVKVKA